MNGKRRASNATAARRRVPSGVAGKVTLTALLASLSLPMLPACTSSSRPPAANPARMLPTPCVPAQLAFTLDAGNGRFDGMSHSGTALTLRNTGKQPCNIPARPMASFMGANRQPSAHVIPTPPAAGTGAAPPLTLAPGASVSSDMRWVSGDVYPGGHCESPAAVTLALGKHTISAPFAGHLCGAGAEPSRYTLTAWHPGAAPSSTVAETRLYTCEDRRTVRATYPDPHTAVLTFDGHTRRLRIAVSADGARYTDARWQWWTKGFHHARLAPLAAGETLASAAGVACQAP